MSFTVCPPGCKGPFADLTASRQRFNQASSHKARDEQRFQSVLQRLGGSKSLASSGMGPPHLISRHVSQSNWPPLKTRDRGVRMVSDPLPKTTQAQINLASYPQAAAYSDYMADRPASGGPTRLAVPGGKSYGPIAPYSGSDKRVTSA